MLWYFVLKKYFSCLLHSLVKYLDFQHLKRNFVLWSLCSHVISSTSQRTRRVWSRRNTNYLFWNKQVKAAALLIHKQLYSLFPTLFVFIKFLNLAKWMDITMARMWLWPLDGGDHLTEVKFTMSFSTFLIYFKTGLLTGCAGAGPHNSV